MNNNKIIKEECLKIELENADIKVTTEEQEKTIKRLHTSLDIIRAEKKSLTSELEVILGKYSIKQPHKEDIIKKITLCDEYTCNTLIKYLELDNLKLTQGIAKTVNKDNVSEVIAYMDGGLARNFSLIGVLEKNVKRKIEFTDRLDGKQKSIKKSL